MSRIKLPPAFSERVDGNDIHGPLNSAITRSCEFYDDPTRGLPFFPEYTDPRVTHIQEVLDATSGLLTPDALAALTPEDVAVLTIGVLLHGSAMHHTADGFLTLIDPSGPAPLIQEMDTRSWSQEWDAYLAGASRWDSRRLRAVLGGVSANQGEDLTRFVKSPTEMGPPDHWPGAYFKFVGEFIRRHHPRLAHEFAGRGVPGSEKDKPLRLLDPSPNNDLSGLVARSRGMALRGTFAYLRTKYHAVHFPQRTHVVFLMVLLRIADYIQLEAHRAPTTSLKVRSLRNPISVGEWAVHQSITDVMPDEFDDQAIMVVTRPADVGTFLKVRSLLDGPQRELDTSWAVPGEVYGRREEGRSLAIRLRRVRSNLDDLAQFRSSVDYIPGRFSFEAAGTGLLKKMVGPLYGDAPEVGIRELLQNAIDAVNERRSHFAPRSDDSGPNVWVRLDGSTEQGGTVTVEDGASG